MSLELKHIAAYLPYNVKVKSLFWNEIFEIERINLEDMPKIELGLKRLNPDTNNYSFVYAILDECRLVLRPMSELTKDKLKELEIIEQTNAMFLRRLRANEIENIIAFSYDSIAKLLSEHYDVFNLIPQGLAIPINEPEAK